MATMEPQKWAQKGEEDYICCIYNYYTYNKLCHVTDVE